jgi:hypothetical protein
MRITAFQAHAPKSISFASAGCLIVAMLVTIVMELAPPQPQFLLHWIDGNTYLRQALPPFGAVEFLQKKATRDDYILSIGDWAAAYSPNPSRFQHVYNNARTYGTSDLENELPLAPWRYLILPNSANRKELESFVCRTRLLREEYSDANFSVYELAQKVASPAAGR